MTTDAAPPSPDAAPGRARRAGLLDALRGTLARCEARLNEVNDRYTFELRPEYRLKMRKTIGRTTRVGMTYDAHARRYEVAVKHAGTKRGEDEDEDEDEDETRPMFWKAMKKVVFDPEEKRVEVFTQRLSCGPLSLRGVGEYDVEQSEWGLRWQLQTFHKEKKRLRSAEVKLTERVRGCMRWDVSSAAPEVEGKVGSGEKFTFDVDVGSYHVSVPRLELKIDLDHM